MLSSYGPLCDAGALPQFDAELRTLIEFTFNTQCAVVQLHDFTDDRETETMSRSLFRLWVGAAIELVGDTRLVFRRNSEALVDHRQTNCVFIFVNLNGHRFVFTTVF